jgi:uncharacterized tellurite resistance protein B-like protein
MSQADSVYDPSEMAIIKSKMTGLFPEGTDFEKKLYQAIREYNTFDKVKLNEVLNDSFHHFKDAELNGQKLIRDLSEIVNADGKVDPAEGKALGILKELIDHMS